MCVPVACVPLAVKVDVHVPDIVDVYPVPYPPGVPCGPGCWPGLPYPGGAAGGVEYPGWELQVVLFQVVLGQEVGPAGAGHCVLTTSTHEVEVNATGVLTTVEVTALGVLTIVDVMVEVNGGGVLTYVEVKGCGVFTTVMHDMEVKPCGDGCGWGFGCGCGCGAGEYGGTMMVVVGCCVRAGRDCGTSHQ